jgi:hypothetical protein
MANPGATHGGIEPITGRESCRWRSEGGDRNAAEHLATELANPRRNHAGHEPGRLTVTVYLELLGSGDWIEPTARGL